ncbi:c-type cytochrome [Coralloluteibacterium thermophilus]|uniref:C-type cytochrome n=1 Tax=Coralloluteibacterium thermophilum TaxID=2707049 RepID=A0ABV9NN17_9GAMM
MHASLVRSLIPLLMLCAGAPALAQTLDEDAMRERLASCAACHGENGEGIGGRVYYPHIAGKPADYLFEQLRGFRDGRRHYPSMTYLVQYMDDAWLREIADFYAAQAPVSHPAATAPLAPATRARAERLVHEGDGTAGVPACTACHGADLAGIEPGIPALVGLPADYVIAQMGGWRNGLRRGLEPDCMAEIAHALSLEDISAVANWLARQPHVPGTRPAAAGSLEPPMACGSLMPAEAAP